MHLEELVPIIVIPSFCLLIGWLVWILTRTQHLETQARVELRRRLTENICSTQDVLKLLQTDEGRALLDAIATEQPISMREILGTLHKGIVCLAVGLGGLSLRLVFPTGFGVFVMAAILTGAIGLGLLISAGLAYHLAKSWRLLRRTTKIG